MIDQKLPAGQLQKIEQIARRFFIVQKLPGQLKGFLQIFIVQQAGRSFRSEMLRPPFRQGEGLLIIERPDPGGLKGGPHPRTGL